MILDTKAEVSAEHENESRLIALNDALQALLQFGVLMLRAGNPASRTREWLSLLATKMEHTEVAVSLTFDSIAISVGRLGEWATALREIGPPNIDVRRLGALERIAQTAGTNDTPPEIIAKLSAIERLPHRFSAAHVAVAIGAASGGFAFINGGGLLEVFGAALSAAIGQWFRSGISRFGLNLYATAALSAVVASGCYVVIALLIARGGFGSAPHPVGVMSSVLFLVPGFPLVAALFDLLQHQTVAAVSRFGHGVMVLLVVAFGLSIVVVLAGVDLSPQPPLEMDYSLKLLLRAVASFAGGCAFAMLYNSSIRTVFAVGLIALVANSLRLALSDFGMMLAPATFFGALIVGLAALLLGQIAPRIALTAPAIIIMIPGLYAFQMIVLFNRGQTLDALQAAASCAFIVGALAMGLATARFFGPRHAGETGALR